MTVRVTNYNLTTDRLTASEINATLQFNFTRVLNESSQGYTHEVVNLPLPHTTAQLQLTLSVY